MLKEKRIGGLLYFYFFILTTNFNSSAKINLINKRDNSDIEIKVSSPVSDLVDQILHEKKISFSIESCILKYEKKHIYLTSKDFQKGKSLHNFKIYNSGKIDLDDIVYKNNYKFSNKYERDWDNNTDIETSSSPKNTRLAAIFFIFSAYILYTFIRKAIEFNNQTKMPESNKSEMSYTSYF